jgi:tRNA pseudouridine32 synthase/23S rRNA pseudouridine746 synthase
MFKAYELLFENEHFIIVDKASGVLSVPGRVQNEDLILGRILEVDFKQTILPIHRLDFEVSGLIMYAKTKEAHRLGNSWFNDKKIFKTYCALTTGGKPSVTENVEMEWKCMLLRGKRRAYEAPHGKVSITKVFFKGLSTCSHFLWDLHPITGRSHQLRYELFRHGHPIVGDRLYGSPKTFAENAQSIALRSYKLDFNHCSEATSFGLPKEIVISSFK